MTVKRPIKIDGDVAYVPLTKGYAAVIDAADVPLVGMWNWNARIVRRADGAILTVYAVRSHQKDGKRITILLHRVIMGAPDGIGVDHRSGDGLDCRRVNLRLASRSENNRNARTRVDNTSGAKGVCWHKQTAKWQARIWVDGARRSLGCFSDISDAAAAYAAASLKHHGEFGRSE